MIAEKTDASSSEPKQENLPQAPVTDGKTLDGNLEGKEKVAAPGSSLSGAQVTAASPSPTNPSLAQTPSLGPLPNGVMPSAVQLGNAVMQQRLTSEQFMQVNELITKHISKLTEIEKEITYFSLKTNLPSLAMFIIGISAMMYLGWINLDPLSSADDPALLRYKIAQYATRHITVYIIFISLIIPVYKMGAYILRQYYSLRKYRMLMTNRIAIFSTVMLTGGMANDSTISHFISDIPDAPDTLDFQTLHEKALDKLGDVIKVLAKVGKDSTGKKKDKA